MESSPFAAQHAVPQGDLEDFIEGMQAAKFTGDAPLYVASGIFSYWSKEGERGVGWGGVPEFRS